jgi:asparagine synthase (glutamine-hydrolysing)
MYRPAPVKFPAWLNAGFVARNDLQARWTEYCDPTRDYRHPSRPRAYDRLLCVGRDSRFDGWDPGYTGFPVEFRRPLLDLRVVRFLLRVPPFPWFVTKELPRQSTRGLLPDEVRRRPKTPLAGYPELEMNRDAKFAWCDRWAPTPEFEEFIDRSAIPHLLGETNAHRLWSNIRPVSLNLWLQNFRKTRPLPVEECHEEIAV